MLPWWLNEDYRNEPCNPCYILLWTYKNNDQLHTENVLGKEQEKLLTFNIDKQ